MSRPLPGTQQGHRASNEPSAPVRRTCRGSLPPQQPGRVPSVSPDMHTPRLQGLGRLNGAADLLDPERRAGSRCGVGMDLGQSSGACRQARPPAANPQPPTVDEVGRLIAAAFDEDEDWGRFLSTKTTTGARRGEICALRWTDRERRQGATSVLLRIILDPEDDAVLDEQEAAAKQRATEAGIAFNPSGYIYSPVPDGSVPFHPDTVSKRYARLARRLGIRRSLKNHRHYNATELINAGYNVRTAAGRLGHSGGGTTTLRVYTAWWSEADQRAAA